MKIVIREVSFLTLVQKKNPLSTDSVDPALLHKNPEKVRRMFAEVARRYDLLNHLLSLGVDVRWRRAATRLAPQPLVGPVLDVCCGTGDFGLAYWRASGKRAQVVGVDFCWPMLQLARQKSERLRVSPPSRWILADALKLPFRDGSFQVVCVAFGIRNVADTGQALGEMARVCQSRGQVVVLEFSLPQAPLIRSVYLWYFRNVLPRVGNAIARNRSNAYTYLPTSVSQFESGEQFLERMAKAGLVDLNMRPLTWGIATVYIGTKP